MDGGFPWRGFVGVYWGRVLGRRCAWESLGRERGILVGFGGGIVSFLIGGFVGFLFPGINWNNKGTHLFLELFDEVSNRKIQFNIPLFVQFTLTVLLLAGRFQGIPSCNANHRRIQSHPHSHLPKH